MNVGKEWEVFDNGNSLSSFIFIHMKQQLKALRNTLNEISFVSPKSSSLANSSYKQEDKRIFYLSDQYELFH